QLAPVLPCHSLAATVPPSFILPHFHPCGEGRAQTSLQNETDAGPVRLARRFRSQDARMIHASQEDQSSASASGPTIISSATASVRPRIAASNRSQISELSFRNCLALSRPCPIRMLS